MMECKRFCIEVWRLNIYFHVSVQPIEYLDRENFKAWVKMCRRNFMTLLGLKPWAFDISFSNYMDALFFARNLARQLGEVVFYNRAKGQLQIVTPREAQP